MKRNEPSKQDQEASISDKCLKGNNCDLFCINLQCKKKHFFLCSNKKCQCRKQHFQCQKSQIDYLKKSINSKVFHLDQCKRQVQKIFDQIIDQISCQRDQLLKTIQKITTNPSLSQIQRKFSNSITNRSQIFVNNGKKTKQIIKKVHKNQDQQQIEKMFIDTVQQFKKSSKYGLQNFNKKIDQQITNIQNTRQIEVQQTQKVKVIGKSNILKSNAQVIRLISFFSQKIKSIKMLYKASENDFRIKKFQQKCETEQNIMVICQTKNSKIIGGYNDFNFYNVRNKPFLFSLTNNQKFTLQNKTNIKKNFFGMNKIQFGTQFIICDKANQLNLSQISCGGSTNQKYKNSILLDCDYNKYFTAKQWQAWVIQFYPTQSNDSDMS